MSVFATLRYIAAHPLSRHSPFRGIGRYLAWQIGARLVPGPVVFDFVEPARLFARAGMTAATANVYVGMQEFEDMAFTLHLLRPGDLFCDVGANVGSYTILASAVAGARSIAFEPVAGTYAWLQQNILLNGVSDKVSAVHAAVGAAIGAAKITTDLDTINHVLANGVSDNHAMSESVDVTTLDATFPKEAPTLIKIDVEGFETAVIDGAERTLASENLRAVIVELNGSGAKYGHDDAETRRRLKSLGFDCVQYLPFERRMVERTTLEPGNAVFVRDREWVAQRLSHSPPFFCRGISV